VGIPRKHDRWWKLRAGWEPLGHLILPVDDKGEAKRREQNRERAVEVRRARWWATHRCPARGTLMRLTVFVVLVLAAIGLFALVTGRLFDTDDSSLSLALSDG